MAVTNEAEVAALKWVADNPPALDPLCGDDGYPTEIEIQRIKTWDHLTPWTRESIAAIGEYVRARWKYADMGYWQQFIDKDGAVFYTISTGGWSGNEELMAALRDSPFGFLCFESHFRGGHYTFELKAWKETRGTTEDANR